MNSLTQWFLLFPLTALLFGCNQGTVQQVDGLVETPSPAPSQSTSIVAKPVSAAGHQDLSRLFSSHGYDLATLDQGAPALVLKAFPADFSKVRPSREKKRLFFLSLLPMVLLANEEIQAERDLVKRLSSRLDHGDALTEQDQKALRAVSRSYRVNGNPLTSPKVRQQLLLRVDTLPPELVLAQAANESAWGTSRFARAANNIFGEWTFTPGTGLVPKNRPEGATYEVRKFDNLYASLQSYMRNLNTNRAYRSLRELRARMRHRGYHLDGETLAAGLTRYSSRGQAYVEDLRKLMRQNKLTRFSNIELRPPAPTTSRLAVENPTAVRRES